MDEMKTTCLRTDSGVFRASATECGSNVHFLHIAIIREWHNWTPAQKALMVAELLYPQAKVDAAERLKTRANGAGTTNLSLPPNGEGKGALALAANRSGSFVTRTTLERFIPVLKAPRTVELVRAGEIKTVAEAVRQALIEVGGEENDIPVGVRIDKYQGNVRVNSPTRLARRLQERLLCP